MKGKSAEVQIRSFDEGTLCAACPAFEFNVCRGVGQVAKECSLTALPQPSEHTILPRRLICRECDLLEVIPIICHGWAASTVTLSDGRRQILSFLLPGDVVSAVLIFEPVIQCSVEAITEVNYRTFKRTEVKALLFKNPDLFSKLSRVWIEEKARVDQLAVDLGRRAADERIARLILNLSDRLARRSLVRDQMMDFPLRQHHIADATGLTVVHVSKVLSEFRRAGLVEINERSLTISDLTGLRCIANMR